MKNASSSPLCFLDLIQMFAQYLVHGEHMNLVLLKDGIHLIVAEDLPLVVWILKIQCLNMIPDLLNRLRPR